MDEPGGPLLDCLQAITRLHGKPVSHTALVAGLPLPDGTFGAAEYVRAAANHGFSARVVKRRLKRISPLLLPVTLVLEDGGACVLTRFVSGKTLEVILPESGTGGREIPLAELKGLYSGYAIFTQPELDTGPARVASPVPRRRSWFWGTLAAYTPYYLEALVAGVLVNVLTIATALYIMNVYDRVVPNNATETLIVLAIGTATAVAFEFCARTLRAYFLDSAGRKADLVLASQIFAQAIGLKMSARPSSSGSFAAQLREFESVREFITAATLTVLMDLPFIAFFIAIIGAIGGPLYLVPLTAVPLVLLVGLLAQIPLSMVIRANQREIAQRHGLLIEAVEGVEMIKAMRAEGLMLGRYEDYSALAGRSANRARTISSVVVHFSAAVQQLVSVVMVFWGVFLIADGELTIGALIACVILIGRGLAPLQQVAALMTRYQQARSAYFTLDALMHQPVEREPGQRFTHRPEVRGAVAMQQVDFTYPHGAMPSLSQVSFRLAPGERVAVLGRVGSGKSTLLRLACGLYAPSAGTVCIDDVDVAQFDPADLRRHIGFVAQEPSLFHGTLRDNIALGNPQADDTAVLEAARLAGLQGLIAGHPDGLQRLVGERGEGLSGGQRQAVANARAFLLEPRILMLDEPTSAMDHNAEASFIAAAREFLADRTLLLVTHKPSMLELVERIIVLDAGRLVLDGPRDDVLKELARPRPAPA
ncbi:MAG: type I secretion system permease/ATPase [Gammaproteobacteria bacterium]